MTAVEWLVEKLNKRWYGLDEGETWNDLIQQALEMEKQQIMQAFDKGKWDSLAFNGTSNEQYYNETYKKNNQ